MILSEIRTKYYPGIEEDVFWNIVRLDPTYNSERPEKKGRYTGWLLTLHLQGSLREEDYMDAAEYLAAFEANKSRIEVRDIGRYRSLPDLYDVVRPYLEVRPVSRNSIKRDEATTVYKDEEWIVVVPHTWEASKLYGAGTRWCTASTYCDDWFKRYTRYGELYINIDRRNGEKYQMLALRDGNRYRYCYDSSDRLVPSGKIGLSSGAAAFFNSLFTFDPEYVPCRKLTKDILFAQADIEHNGFYHYEDGRWRRVLEEFEFIGFDSVGKTMLRCYEADFGRCLVDLKTFELIPVSDCDFCNEFDGMYAVAWKNAKIGVMDRLGIFHKGTELLSQAVKFCNGIAPVGLHRNVYNFIDEQGELVFDVNFKWCGEFHEGMCEVVFRKGNKGYVSSDRRELPLPDVMRTGEFSGNFAVVSLKKGKNLLRKDGSFLFDEPVRGVSPMKCEELYRIQLPNGRYTFCDKWTGLFTDLQFIDSKEFVLGLMAVRMEDGRWNFMRPDGTLLLSRGVDWCTDFDRDMWMAKIHTYRGDNYVNTDGELLHPWPKMKPKRHR